MFFSYRFFAPTQTEGHRFRSVYCECVCSSVRSQKREMKEKTFLISKKNFAFQLALYGSNVCMLCVLNCVCESVSCFLLNAPRIFFFWISNFGTLKCYHARSYWVSFINFFWLSWNGFLLQSLISYKWASDYEGGEQIVEIGRTSCDNLSRWISSLWIKSSIWKTATTLFCFSPSHSTLLWPGALVAVLNKNKLGNSIA